MSNTIIRSATSTDFPYLLEIDAESFPQGIAYDSKELSWFMRRSGAETFVLVQEGTIEAFIIIEVDYKTRSATLVTLDVRKHCRRLGYGSSLLQRSEVAAIERNLTTFKLQVDVSNPGAIAFYQKHGFSTVRRLVNYYADDHDAWLMTKTLPQSAGT